MKLFYIKALLKIKVDTISGLYEQTVSKLVKANSEREAVSLFQSRMRQDFPNHKEITFNFLEIADEI